MRRSRKTALLVAISASLLGTGWLFSLPKKDDFRYLGIASNLNLSAKEGWGENSFGHVFVSDNTRFFLLDDPADGFTFFGRLRIGDQTFVYQQDTDGIDSIAVSREPYHPESEETPSVQSRVRPPTNDEIMKLSKGILHYPSALVRETLRAQALGGIPPSRTYPGNY